MTTDINERIARLVEPEPVWDTTIPWHESAGRGWVRINISASGNREHDLVSPATFTESIDTSMAVIQRRWPGALVHLWTAENESAYPVARIWSFGRMKILGDSSDITVRRKDIDTAQPVAHALALALLAALEAETKP